MLLASEVLSTGPHPKTSNCVAAKSEQEIRDAVSACLKRCTEGGTPLGVVAQYLAELHDAGWDYSDTFKVERTARALLAGIVSDDTDTPS